MQFESRPTLHSALRGSLGFILLALGLLPTLGVLILTMIAADDVNGLTRAILVVPAIAIVALLLWELWAIATLRMKVDDHGLRWRAARRRVQLAWDDIRAVAYTPNTTQIRLTTANNKPVCLVTRYLPPQELDRIKQVIAERVPGESAIIAGDKPAAQLNVAACLLSPASFLAAYLVARSSFADGIGSSLPSLWIGFYFFFIVAPLIPTLLLAGPYWLARRKVMRGAAWILGISWSLLVALFLVATQLPDVPSQ